MTCHCLILMSLIIPLPYIGAERERDSVITFGKEQLYVWQVRTTPRRPGTDVFTDSRSRKGQNTTRHHQHHLSNVSTIYCCCCFWVGI